MCISHFPSSKDAREIPPCLSEGPALHFLVSKVLLSLTATPLSCSSFSSIGLPFIFFPSSARLCLLPQPPSHSSFSHLSASLALANVPLSFPPDFFLLHLLRSPPPAAISEQNRGWRERFFDLVNCASSFVFTPRQAFLRGCVCVVLTAVALSSSIWVEVTGTGNGCIIVESAPVASRLIRSQLKQRSLCCNKAQHNSLHTPTGLTRRAAWVRSFQQLILMETHGKCSPLRVTHTGRGEEEEEEEVRILSGRKESKRTRCSIPLFTFFRAGGEESEGLMTQSRASGAELGCT